jgi:DNA mismatch endonuclease (patch repair protein)
MPDVFSKEKRSEVMSHIKNRGNKETELVMINILRKYHITGWRRNQILFGKPDFVFYKRKIVIFVDGCFWHCCPIHSKEPKNNKEFWKRKLKNNKKRDELVTHVLKGKGWQVLRIWEHELINPTNVVKKVLLAFEFR